MIVPITLATTNVAYWKQERLILEFASENPVHIWTNLQGDYNDPIAIYQPAGGKVYIDLTDYIRAYGDCSVHFEEEAEVVTIFIVSVSVAGLINPYSVIVPYHFGDYYSRVQMPNRMIEPLEKYPLIAEFYYSGAGASFTGGASLSQDKRQITITGDFTYKPVPYGDSRKYNLVRRMCGVQYAYLRWQSFTGITRVHIFEVTKPKIESADSYMLMPVDNEYSEIKGRVDGFTLRLNDLCPYDLWYYSDVITSSKVEVSLDGENYTQVKVTTKNYTLPDGDTKQNGKLEIAVNWKRYDAVAM